MTAEEKYQAELTQAEHDHHVPTAGAMTGHILSNLVIHRNKLVQARGYITGPAHTFVAGWLDTALVEQNNLFDQISQKLLDEDEVIPTTTAEFTRYSMLEESGQLKYEDGATILAGIIADFNTQLMFITRGIALAQKENKYGLEIALKELYSWIRHQIYVVARFTDTAVVEKEEDDDED